MRTVSFTLLIALVLIVGACASSSSGGSQNKSGTITLEEIEMSGLVFTDAHEIVRQFRPQWLIKRGKATISPSQGADATLLDYVAVYLDNHLMGDPEALHAITALSVQQIEHYNTARAQRLGSRSHPHGAIVVRTKSR